MDQVFFTSKRQHETDRPTTIKIKGMRLILIGIYNKFLKILCSKAKIALPKTTLSFDNVSFNSLICSLPVCFLRVCIFMDNVEHIKCHFNELVKMLSIIPKLLQVTKPDLKILSDKLIAHLKTEDFKFLYNGDKIVLLGNGFLDEVADFLNETFVSQLHNSVCSVATKIDLNLKYFDYIVCPASYIHKTETYHPRMKGKNRIPFWILDDLNTEGKSAITPIANSSSVGFSSFYNQFMEKLSHKNIIEKIDLLRSSSYKNELIINKISEFVVSSLDNKRKRDDDGDNNNNKQTKQHQVCVICIDNTADHVYYPCGHIGVCVVCLNKAEEKCPICNNPAQGMRFYFCD